MKKREEHQKIHIIVNTNTKESIKNLIEYK